MKIDSIVSRKFYESHPNGFDQLRGIYEIAEKLRRQISETSEADLKFKK